MSIMLSSLDTSSLGLVLSDSFRYQVRLNLNDGQEVSLFELKAIQPKNADRDCMAEYVHPKFGSAEITFHPLAAHAGQGCGFTLLLTPSRTTEAVISLEVLLESSDSTVPFFMIPGVLYGTNSLANSKSAQVQFNYHGDISWPKTSVIFTRADRSTHNAVLALLHDRVVGLRIDEALYKNQNRAEFDFVQYNGLGIDTRNQDRFDRLVLTIGYRHFPRKYHGNLTPATSDGPQFSPAAFEGNRIYRVSGHLFWSGSRTTTLFGYEDCLRFFYKQTHQAPGNNGTYLQGVRNLASALINSYNQKYHLFPVIHGDPNFSEDFGVTSWTGGMQVAYPLLRASPWVPEARETALDFMDHLVDYGIHPASGLFYEAKSATDWQIMGWWKGKFSQYTQAGQMVDEFFSAYVNGQALCYLLKSYRWLIEAGGAPESAERWLTSARRLVDRVVASRRYDGAFGVYFSAVDGSVLSYQGFQGVWFLASVAELFAITGDPKYHMVFVESADYYASVFDTLEPRGTPIDAGDSVDEEGNLAYITALATYHKVTGDTLSLNRLVHAIHFEFSWKFAYNTRHQNEPLRSLEWHSSGGSLTSTHNVHIHQMGNLVTEEIEYAYQCTGDSYIKDRLEDTLNWGLGTYNRFDGEFGYGKKGWATEQFYHTDGVQNTIANIEDGGIWPVYLTWAASCVLLSCCHAAKSEVTA